MKIIIETNGALTECHITGHSYENPTTPYFNAKLKACDPSTQYRAIDAMKDVIKEWEKCGTCEDCLFYVDWTPQLFICVEGNHSEEYDEIQTNCKKWVENTPENAEEWLRHH